MQKQTLASLDVFIANKDPTNLITSVYRKKALIGVPNNFYSFTFSNFGKDKSSVVKSN